jgi:hypothetical protein
MNNTSMDLVRVSVKREMTREMTEDTKKIHNEGTKITKTNEGDCPVAPRIARTHMCRADASGDLPRSPRWLRGTLQIKTALHHEPL